jgi:prolyl-tRNA synthetase
VALDIQAKLRAKGISVKFDNDTQNKPGWKFAEYELKGVPVRIAMGPRDLENNLWKLQEEIIYKEVRSIEGLDSYIEELLKTIQQDIYNKAFEFRKNNITKVDTYEEFKKVLEEKGGFIYAHWDGTAEEEEQIKGRNKSYHQMYSFG